MMEESVSRKKYCFVVNCRKSPSGTMWKSGQAVGPVIMIRQSGMSLNLAMTTLLFPWTKQLYPHCWVPVGRRKHQQQSFNLTDLNSQSKDCKNEFWGQVAVSQKRSQTWV